MPAQDKVEDCTYFTERAEEERQRAAVCEDNAAALAHLRLADEYNRRAQEVAAMPRSATN